MICLVGLVFGLALAVCSQSPTDHRYTFHLDVGSELSFKLMKTDNNDSDATFSYGISTSGSLQLHCEFVMPCSHGDGLRIFGKERNLLVTRCTDDETPEVIDSWFGNYILILIKTAKDFTSRQLRCSVNAGEKQVGNSRTSNNGETGVEGNNLLSQQCSCSNENATIIAEEGMKRRIVPWEVYITVYVQLNDELSTIDCSGGIITSHYALTAAHCFGIYPVHEVMLYVSTVDVDAVFKDFCKVDSYVLHPDFKYNLDEDIADNDIALVKVEKEFRYGAHVAPLCLPWSFPRDSFRGKTATSSGWDTNPDHANSDLLEVSEFEVITNDLCRLLLKIPDLKDNMVCGKTRPGSPCHSQSGGPMTIELGLNTYVLGISSLGKTCVGESKISLFTRVPPYLTWILESLDGSLCHPEGGESTTEAGRQ